MMNIIENINMALFLGYFVPNANIIVQTGEISNETTILCPDVCIQNKDARRRLVKGGHRTNQLPVVTSVRNKNYVIYHYKIYLHL